MCSTSRPGQRCRHRSSLLQAVSQTAFLLYLHHSGQALTTASANLLQAQTAFLLHLHHSGQASDVVFMDTDILVVDDLATAFCQEFDYALTLSDAVDMPINIGMQVRGGLLAVSIDLLLFGRHSCLSCIQPGRQVWGSLLAVQTILSMTATLLCVLAAPDVKERVCTFQATACSCCTMHSTGPLHWCCQTTCGQQCMTA